jgi:hypothetical protein
MNKRLLVAGILAVVAGVVRALVALALLPIGPRIPLGRMHELLLVPAIEAALPLLVFAVTLAVLQAGLARQTGHLGRTCALAAIAGVILAAVGVATHWIATPYECTLDAACQQSPSSRALDMLHTLGIVGTLLLAAALLGFALVAWRTRLPLRWAGVFAVLGLAALPLLPVLQSSVGGTVTALSIGLLGLALTSMWVAGCFLLAGASFSALTTPSPLPTSVPAPQP